MVVEANGKGIRVARGDKLKSVELRTLPYPGFPTDLQAQMMAMLTQADGTSVITETIFENRFMHAQELARMGADIVMKGPTAVVRGPSKLSGAPVMATDLRASMGLDNRGPCRGKHDRAQPHLSSGSRLRGARREAVAVSARESSALKNNSGAA